MAKKEKLTIQHKSEAQWKRLYDSYLRQYSKLSESLNGLVNRALTIVEYKGIYTNALNQGIKTNITRKLVQQVAEVSYDAARVRVGVYKKFMETIEKKIDSGEEVPAYEFEAYTKLLRKDITLKNIRRDVDFIDIFRDYLDEVNLRRNVEKEGYISYREFITSP